MFSISCIATHGISTNVPFRLGPCCKVLLARYARGKKMTAAVRTQTSGADHVQYTRTRHCIQLYSHITERGKCHRTTVYSDCTRLRSRFLRASSVNSDALTTCDRTTCETGDDVLESCVMSVTRCECALHCNTEPTSTRWRCRDM